MCVESGESSIFEESDFFRKLVTEPGIGLGVRSSSIHIPWTQHSASRRRRQEIMPVVRREDDISNLEVATGINRSGQRRVSPMEDSAIERNHDKFFVQKVLVRNELAGVDRLELFRRLCQGKRVLHIGCVDHPLFNPDTNLHIQLEKYCAVLDGFDVNVEAFVQMRPFVKGKFLSKWEDVCDEYDLVLVPEVLEHVPNVKEFLGRIARILTAQVIITVPDAFQCFRRHFDYNSETSTFVEIVHPDHNCWYTPYTLMSTLKKHTDWAIEGIWFVNSISVMAIASVKQPTAESVQGVSAVPGVLPKVLLACDYYWPSSGGVETIAANLGTSLRQCGYEVEIATRSLPERIANVHCEMQIHSLDASTQMPNGLPMAARELRSLIESGRYAAVIIMADPLTWLMWSLEGARVPNHTRVLVQPLINENGYASWKGNKEFRSRLAAVLRQATDIVCLTRKGPDACFLESEDISFVNIPNATMPESVTTNFRVTYGFEEGRPLVIHVANLWRVKNQVGLIQSFRSTGLDVQMALIGNPSGDKDYEHALRLEVQKDPRFKLLHGLYGEKIAAAMKAADLVVLPSLGEVFPVSLLEAMSHGKAWLATPQCGAANELAGGIIARFDQFPAIIERLLANPDVLSRLGYLGRCHWEKYFQWPCVTRAWSDLIQKGARPSSWEVPQDIWEETLSLRRRVMANGGPSSFFGGSPTIDRQTDLSCQTGCGALNQEEQPGDKSGRPIIERQAGALEQTVSVTQSMRRIREGDLYLPLVSVIIPTHNRPQQLRRAVASVLEQIHENYELIIVNDAGCEVEGDLAGMNAAGQITYIRHATNRGMAAARNTGLRLARGKYIAYLDDDDRFLPNHLDTLVRYLETHDERVAYTDAWRIHEQLHETEYLETGRDLPYSYDFDSTRLLISNYFPVLSVMHERACVEETGLFDESLTTHEDWDFWIRMSRRYPFKHLKKITAEFTWRTDGSSTTSSRRADFSRTAAIIYEKYRKVSEAIPGVREMQARAIKELQILTQAEPAYTCSIVIPVWNKVELTRQCLIALASSTTNVSFEVIVVDNGSTDGTEEFVNELKGDIQIICNQENLGFAKACNQGARAARGKYLVFLNNDTIPQPHWLKPLVSEVEEHPEVGIVGSKLLFADESIQHAGVVFMRSLLSPYHIYLGAPGTLPAVNQRREFQAVTAACMLIRREVFEAVHGFDEGFINGFEDVDLCLRVREQGHQVIYQPRSVLYHLESQTPGRNDHDEHNSRLLQGRWGNHWWLGDEDFHYHTDGFKLLEGLDDQRFATQVKPLSDVPEQAAWAHVAAAQAAALKKDWGAVKWELQLVDDWPDDRFVLSWAATVCERLHEPTLQVKFLARYLELKDDLPMRLRVIRELLEQGDLGAAERHLQKLLTNCPAHAEGLLLKGILGMQREQYEQAEAAFDSAMREGADRKKCLMGMGMAAMGRSYTQGAWERFVRVLAEYPDDAEAVHWLLRAGTAQNRWRELSGQLRSYVGRNAGDVAARFAFASVLLRGEQIEAARREYDALRQIAPSYDGLDDLGRAITGREAALALEAASS